MRVTIRQKAVSWEGGRQKVCRWTDGRQKAVRRKVARAVGQFDSAWAQQIRHRTQGFGAARARVRRGSGPADD
nr:hypothetical protein Ade03nite_52110 [Actinoplanes derwentensis]